MFMFFKKRISIIKITIHIIQDFNISRLEIKNFKPLEVIERAAVESTSIVTPDGEKGFIALSAERSGEFFVAPDLEDNTEFEAEASEFIDFTDIDPFSEGDL